MYGTAFCTHIQNRLLVKSIIIPVLSLTHHPVKTFDGVKLRLRASEQLCNDNRATRQRQKLLRSALFKGQDFMTLEDGADRLSRNVGMELSLYAT